MSTTLRLPVVVGVDGVRGRLATVDLAAEEAQRRGAPLTIVHVWPGRYASPFRTRSTVVTPEAGQRLLDLAAQRVRLAGHDVDISTRLIDGAPAASLAQCSAEAQLLVVGYRDDPLSRYGWGSTAAYLAHHAFCPLLVDRGVDSHKGPVVVAASARESGTATLACAFAEAAQRAAPLVAVHVWSAADADGAARRPTAAGYAAARDEADRMLAEALAGWSGQYPDVAVKRLVLHDLDVAYTLDRASRRGRLFVAGRGRRGRFAELIYGSIEGPMLRTSACPVLLVPASWSEAGPAPARPARSAGLS